MGENAALSQLQRQDTPFQCHTSHRAVLWPTFIVSIFICSYLNAILLLSNANNSFNSTLYSLEKPH